MAATQDHGLSAADAQSIAALMSLLVDPLRCRIISALLVADHLCVGGLALALRASQDATPGL